MFANAAADGEGLKCVYVRQKDGSGSIGAASSSTNVIDLKDVHRVHNDYLYELDAIYDHKCSQEDLYRYEEL